MSDAIRIGDAAAALGVGVDTLRRWERDGRLRVERTSGGHRMIPADEVARLLGERRRHEPIRAQSARNQFDGTVTAVKKQGLVATVEIMAGSNRIVALTTREAVEEMGLKPGMRAVASVKATNVVVQLPGL